MSATIDNKTVIRDYTTIWVLVAMLLFTGAAMDWAQKAPREASGGPVQAFRAEPAPPALQLRVRPQTGFSPLRVEATVRQQPEQLRGREVCLRVLGEEVQQSCWQLDNPPVLVTRAFTIHTPGEYTVQAVARGLQSETVTIIVVGQ